MRYFHPAASMEYQDTCAVNPSGPSDKENAVRSGTEADLDVIDDECEDWYREVEADAFIDGDVIDDVWADWDDDALDLDADA